MTDPARRIVDRIWERLESDVRWMQTLKNADSLEKAERIIKQEWTEIIREEFTLTPKEKS